MSKRTQKQSNSDTTPSPVRKRVENSWVLLAREELLDNSSFDIITLPHPANGKPAKYCLDESQKKIYEVVTFNETHRSWFIGDSVKSDGSIQMLTPINPIFLLLPRLKEQCSNRAIPLEDLLSEKGFDKILEYVGTLDKVADLKGQSEMKAYKYNEDKTLTWLTERVHRLAKVLRAKNIHVTSGSVSATFVTSNIDNNSIDEEFYSKYAFGMISEYLEEYLMSQLEKKFGFQSDLIETIGKKRKSEVLDSKENKKMKTTLNENGQTNEIVDYDNKTEVKKQKVLSAKEKARQKAASGTKILSSFFTKK